LSFRRSAHGSIGRKRRGGERSWGQDARKREKEGGKKEKKEDTP